MKCRAPKTAIAGLKTSGCMKLLFPQVQEVAMTAVTLNTAGGITGGDQLKLNVFVGEAAHLRLTTQAAERVYRAHPGEVGSVNTQLQIAAGARLDWLPQETILFDHGALNRRLTIDMAGDARLLLVEPLVFGRAAMGEVITQITLRDHLRVHRDGTLIFADTLRFDGDLHQQMQRMALGGAAGAMASALLASTEAECEALLPQLRAMLPDNAGVSLLRPDLLFLRAVATDSFDLRRVLIPALTLMNGAALPRTWTI
ncbi:Urease accessory protein UreD [Thalassovita autumnalis]|uniref:Urease accessory protein UreD n=1 Tax=Thalassovita autumnalis TaxID=2072972 RepID=A0A0P1FRL0_9RHOB|nr:urease accessory protein UreD [Thalassovita autumnalis]CUH65042.1 Urease accessory protein UreD [Thalassovita autumnalis]CUH71132.1 Urease accessory protein UreD [Thalassovita autumnalis]